VGDVDFSDGAFVIAGTDRRVSFAAVAQAAYVPHNFPLETLEPGLQETAVYDPPSFAFSNGAHVCELEIDPETGRVEIVGFWAVDDIGTVINPMIVEAQIHGGIAQGLGQALLEHCIYDGGGQPVCGSFMDYALARADDLPSFITECDKSQPCTTIPLASKAAGKRAPSARPRPSSAQRSMRSPPSASPISICRSHPSRCGAGSGKRSRKKPEKRRRQAPRFRPREAA
jgi:aerobic carbon-monoxide dehydrogenase large subunit